MKKVLLLAAFAVVGLAANAQYYVGGNLGFTNEGVKNNKTTTLTIAPEFGYNINSKWAVGGKVGYTLVNPENTPETSTFHFAPYVRYTACTLGPVSIHFDGGFALENSKVKDQNSVFGWGVGVTPGIAVALSKNVSFLASFGMIGYQAVDDANWSKVGYDFSTENLQFGVVFNF